MEYDIAIIGGGPAGYTAAERASENGLKTILFEKNAIGGVCLNEGCIPTKTLLYSAKILDSIKSASKYGIVAMKDPSFDLAKIIDRKNKTVRKLTLGVKARLTGNGVTIVEGEARIAEEAGACAVMALERIPADIRAAGGVSRMSDPKMIKGIQEAVSIPVMAKCRIGHFVEAQILEAIEIDYIDESEVLSPADDVYHIDKHKFSVPFVCGAKDLGEALRRINEGASMIRTKGEPGTGDVVQAVRHLSLIHI